MRITNAYRGHSTSQKPGGDAEDRPGAEYFHWRELFAVSSRRVVLAGVEEPFPQTQEIGKGPLDAQRDTGRHRSCVTRG